MSGQSSSPIVHVIGIGDDGIEGLPDAARQRILEADAILGSERALAMVSDGPTRRIVLGTDMAELLRHVQQRGQQKLVVLASGDPLFYGVARYLIERIGKDDFEVVPHVSSMQLAFARVKEPWEEAYLGNVANTPIETVLERIRTAEKVGLFTSSRHDPPTIARLLLDSGIDYFRVYVCENLGTRNEVITQGSLKDIAAMSFGPLNVMILARLAELPDRRRDQTERKLFGNADEAFLQRRPKRGLLTPAEVRILALAEMSIRPNSIVWDVGAGSGSVAIEAAQIACEGTVYAIEPDIEDCDLIRDNAATFAVKNVHIVCGWAPEAFEGLPPPDAVFIGGIGRQTAGILRHAYEHLQHSGRLVANVASLENVTDAVEYLRQQTPQVGLLMINLARGLHQLESIRFEAVNPSFLIFAVKPAK